MKPILPSFFLIIRLLLSPDEDVREQAAWALGMYAMFNISSSCMDCLTFFFSCS
ncbi:hypothetical protein EON64_16195 [archaeon]|nr:MAG: hypothetical protein EON64_16195 [archaeon]